MMYMNEYEIQRALDDPRLDPVAQAAAKTLYSLMQAVNGCSDGWPYWSAPLRAAKRLMEIVQGYRPATDKELRVANAQVRRFSTVHHVTFDVFST